MNTITKEEISIWLEDNMRRARIKKCDLQKMLDKNRMEIQYLLDGGINFYGLVMFARLFEISQEDFCSYFGITEKANTRPQAINNVMNGGRFLSQSDLVALIEFVEKTPELAKKTVTHIVSETLQCVEEMPSETADYLASKIFSGDTVIPDLVELKYPNQSYLREKWKNGAYIVVEDTAFSTSKDDIFNLNLQEVISQPLQYTHSFPILWAIFDDAACLFLNDQKNADIYNYPYNHVHTMDILVMSWRWLEYAHHNDGNDKITEMATYLRNSIKSTHTTSS